MHERLLLSIFNKKRIITWNNKEYVHWKLFEYIISLKKKTVFDWANCLCDKSWRLYIVILYIESPLELSI